MSNKNLPPSKSDYAHLDLDRGRAVFACKHESSDRAIVKALYHRARIGLEVGLCAACDAKRLKEDRILQSVAAALEGGLQPLSGTREQVEQAERLRADLFRVIKKESALLNDEVVFTAQEREDAQEILDAVRAEAAEQTEASWWLNERHRDKPGLLLIALCEAARTRLQELEDKESPRFAPSSCGHPNDFYPLGSMQKRLCASCHVQAKERGGLTREAPQGSVEGQLLAGLPALEGSEKQVAWAEELRDQLLALLLRIERQGNEQDTLRAACQRALQQVKAKWWIDQPHRAEELYQAMRSSIETGAAMPRADGLLELIGTEKQVAWAERIRKDTFQELVAQEQSETSVPRQEALAKVRQDLLARTFAGDWIAAQSERPESYITEMCRYYMSLT